MSVLLQSESVLLQDQLKQSELNLSLALVELNDLKMAEKLRQNEAALLEVKKEIEVLKKKGGNLLQA